MKETIEQQAEDLARHIFQCGDNGNSPCTRLQFKGGSWPRKETDQGGLCVGALANIIADWNKRD